MAKRLYRSRTDRILAGVCGGLAKYFNIDPVLVRILTVVIGLVIPGSTIIAYIIMAIIVPLEESGASGTS
jgi:phage shock protein PspC (stress-responsive transcriptional regulator)